MNTLTPPVQLIVQKRKSREWENESVRPFPAPGKCITPCHAVSPPSSPLKETATTLSHPYGNSSHLKHTMYHHQKAVLTGTVDPTVSLKSWTPFPAKAHGGLDYETSFVPMTQSKFSCLDILSLDDIEIDGNDEERISEISCHRKTKKHRVDSSHGTNQGLHVYRGANRIENNLKEMSDKVKSPLVQWSQKTQGPSLNCCFICGSRRSSTAHGLMNPVAQPAAVLTVGRQSLHSTHGFVQGGEKRDNSLLRYFAIPTRSSSMLNAVSTADDQDSTGSFRCNRLSRKDNLETCAFCDREACTQHCVRTCETCQSRLCNFCSTIDYNGRMERTVCLDCYSGSTNLYTGSSSRGLQSMDLS